jgi:hypothetical protein
MTTENDNLEFDDVEIENLDADQIEEATVNAASLTPKSRKSEMMSALVNVVGSMSKQDLSDFLQKTLEQVGKEPDSVPDNSAHNRATLSAHGVNQPRPVSEMAREMVREDVETIFEGQELSEEVKTQISTLFEAAVNNRVAIEEQAIIEHFEQYSKELQEHYAEQTAKEITESIDELHEQVNKYMDYVASQWIEKNELAIQESFKVQATSHFIKGLKNLFAESMIDLPENDVNVVEELVGEIETIREQLNQTEAEKNRLQSLVEQAEKEVTFDEIAEGLAATQIEKFKTLSEGIEFSSVEEFGEKLKIIREQFFDKGDVAKVRSSSIGLINEEVIGDEQDEPQAVVPAHMQNYVSAISRTVIKS